MRGFLPLTLLGAAIAKAEPTRLEELCKSEHVQLVLLQIDSQDEDNRLLEHVCATSLCHLSAQENDACAGKKVVLDLVQGEKDYKDYHALEVYRNNMKAREPEADYFFLDGVNIRVTAPARMDVFFKKLSALMSPPTLETPSIATLAQVQKESTPENPEGVDSKPLEKRSETSSGQPSEDSKATPKNDEKPTVDLDSDGTKPKPYLSITVDEKVTWSAIEPYLGIVANVIYLAKKFPECTAESNDIVCVLKGKDVPYMINIEELAEDSEDKYDYYQYRNKFDVGEKFAAFIAGNEVFGIEAPAAKVLAIQK